MEESAFIISLVAVVIATTSTAISYLLFRDSRDPHVVVYATPDARRPSIISLILENTGSSAEWDLKFEASAPIPDHAMGIENAPVPTAMKNGPLVDGMVAFGPGARRTITWGQYDGLNKGLPDGYIDITASYYSKPTLAFRRRKHTTVSRLDVISFVKSDASDNNWDKKMAKELGRIATTLDAMRSRPENALKTMEVEPYDYGDDA